MNNVLIVHTSWYEKHISQMIKVSSEILNNDFKCSIVKAQGAIELAALAKNKLNKNDFVGVIFIGVIIRGETSHYDLVTQETFRSIGSVSYTHQTLPTIYSV